ncbi:adenosylcobalamin-dependent ribonucleoside-diphosphate reductase [Halorussus halophilus]|uniref:adenosylcobalamin-dependent ribonucleoside-diphosphate reductase n=1 Tax=Halorussus halophilus TaxID=2650975 RepID=UPI001300E7E6|nr:adenosylcobalamin-dependent ribonucleoside-diphosphate reductase [Halorussus halophilus]
MRSPTDSIRLPVKRTTGETLEERLTENVYRRVLPARYLLKDNHGRVVETPEELFERVARNVAAVEAKYGNDPIRWANRFEKAMTDLEFVPNSPTLMNAGTEVQQLAACFVVSPRDTLDSIFETLRRAATIFQSGGGVGYSFSRLRPKGDQIRSTGGTASGPVSFMRVYDTMCEQIKQGGKRRGAQMGILRADHPDVGRFCVAKRREGEFSNFNFSVGITDEFYEAVRENRRYSLVNPRTGDQHVVTEATAQFYSTAFENAGTQFAEENVWRDYAGEIPGLDAYRGQTDFRVGEPMTLPAGFVWQLLVDSAWRNGEPGLFALDTTNRDHSFDVVAQPNHRIEATNPCGEQGLENFEACNLGHVNLSLLVTDDATPWFDFREDVREDLAAVVQEFLQQAIDWQRLARIVRDGVRFLDDVVTASVFPIPEIESKVTALRKVGLGIMGFAELLIQLGVRYGSPASYEIARQVMARLNRESKLASHELALERGPFPEWYDSKYATPTKYPEWFARHTGLRPTNWTDGFALRNHSTTTIAPTGTTSMIANTSGGCEPLFDVVYFKNVGRDVQGSEMLVEFEDYFLQTLEANGMDPDAVRAEAKTLLRANEFEGPESLSIPPAIAEAFVTAGDLSPAEHVRMQAAFQRHVDSGISKTINFPFTATRADVNDAYHLAVEEGCKGVTVYRDRSRRTQVLTTHPDDVGRAGGQPAEARCCPI